MATKAKDINFYQRWREQPRTQDHKAARVALPFVLVTVVGVVVFALLFADNYRLTLQIDETQTWLQAPETVTALQKVMDTENANTAAAQGAASVTKAMAEVESYPAVNSTVLNAIAAAGGAKITMLVEQYSAGNGVLSFSAQSPVVIDIPGYIRSLQATGLFRKVDYVGYGLDSNTKLYTINVTCSLKAEAGKGAQP